MKGLLPQLAAAPVMSQGGEQGLAEESESSAPHGEQPQPVAVVTPLGSRDAGWLQQQLGKAQRSGLSWF